jgi:FkbM family methyltransferase
MNNIYIQIGSGAGDKDKRANYRDGFTEFIKKQDKNCIAKIICVEPNPINIPLLKEAWKDYPMAEIYQIGIRPNNVSKKYLTFYYAEEDAPHYQTFSANKEHVKKHYPNSVIQSIDIETLTLEEFILEKVKNNRIELLALDIEGVDSEVILSVNWREVNLHRLSFEFIHLGSYTEEVLKHLGRSGFMFVGMGLDPNGFDLLYEKI